MKSIIIYIYNTIIIIYIYIQIVRISYWHGTFRCISSSPLNNHPRRKPTSETRKAPATKTKETQTTTRVRNEDGAALGAAAVSHNVMTEMFG